jgi:hypothetical protein
MWEEHKETECKSVADGTVGVSVNILPALKRLFKWLARKKQCSRDCAK